MEDKTHIYSKIFSGNYSPEDLAWYEAEQAANPTEVEQFRSVWELTSQFSYPEFTSTAKSWDQLKNRKQQSSKQTIFKLINANYFKWSAAAVLVIGLFSLFYFSNIQNNNAIELQEIQFT